MRPYMSRFQMYGLCLLVWEPFPISFTWVRFLTALYQKWGEAWIPTGLIVDGAPPHSLTRKFLWPAGLETRIQFLPFPS